MPATKQNENAPVPAQLEKPMEDNKVTIYVWSTGFNTLGHVSMKLNGVGEGDPGYYLSIWPKSTAAGGFTSVLPLKATFSRALEKDCMQEAIRPPEDFCNLMEPVEILPVQPDKVFVVDGLDTSKIREELTRIEKGLETGETRYQLLLPKIGVANLLRSYRSTKSEEGHRSI